MHYGTEQGSLAVRETHFRNGLHSAKSQDLTGKNCVRSRSSNPNNLVTETLTKNNKHNKNIVTVKKNQVNFLI